MSMKMQSKLSINIPLQRFVWVYALGLHMPTTHHGNVKLGEQMGLTPLFSAVASEDDWDAYEGLYASSIEEYCYENPDDPDVDAMLTRIRSWRNTYLEWGRELNTVMIGTEAKLNRFSIR
ncbi:hypothetical protein [Brevibacillus centrosporus]|uniref:hypothetical protein n=1 Tax=Brevibacillus centrosporus TaxID=54910 RepID=UPI0039879E2B